MPPTDAFASGELALVLDPEGKSFLIRLADADTLHHHRGAIRHADIIGQLDGTVVRSSQGRLFWAVRPRLMDYQLAMTRRTGIVYPKDAAQLISALDISPGDRVLEAGTGSGALTLSLLRAVGSTGRVTGYESRREFLDLTRANVEGFGPVDPARLSLFERDIYDGIDEVGLDRLILDLAEPWRVVPHLASAVRPGGWVGAYTPSITQASQFVDALRSTSRFVQTETVEVLVRGWHVLGQALRPEHEMVGHTGFLSYARLAVAR